MAIVPYTTPKPKQPPVSDRDKFIVILNVILSRFKVQEFLNIIGDQTSEIKFKICPNEGINLFYTSDTENIIVESIRNLSPTYENINHLVYDVALFTNKLIEIISIKKNLNIEVIQSKL